MTKMLRDRIPGEPQTKVLVLSFDGVIVHKTYNLGVGVELFKRPGLTAFLYKMSQNYDVVIFGNGDSGEINETAESLDPTEQIMKRGGQM